MPDAASLSLAPAHRTRGGRSGLTRARYLKTAKSFSTSGFATSLPSISWI